MKLHDEFRDVQEKFQILAFHDPRAKDFAYLDTKLEKLQRRVWKARPLPFPILLDSTGKTIRTFGVAAFPTMVLIDPDGKVVRGGSERMLDQKLRSIREDKKKGQR